MGPCCVDECPNRGQCWIGGYNWMCLEHHGAYPTEPLCDDCNQPFRLEDADKLGGITDQGATFICAHCGTAKYINVRTASKLIVPDATVVEPTR